MTKRTSLFLFLLFLVGSILPISAQRIQQPLGRGVVAVENNSQVLVTWRKLAQEPENCTYNLYKRASGISDYVKVNTIPITKTNYQTTRAIVPYNTELAVTIVANGVESEKSNPFLFKSQAYADVFFDFNFETKVLNPNEYKAKFGWPVDLNGSGEFDAIVVDRLYCGTSQAVASHKLQCYKLDGTCLWTVDMGPNVDIDGGQNDMVTAYDINCDGKSEVIVKSSDATRFWDAANGTFGKYAHGSSIADTDGDGIVNYRKETTTKNPPFYISVIDATTGAEIECSELKYAEVHDGSDQYSRTNRTSYMTDNEGSEYAFMQGHFAICYFDGIHPSIAMEMLDRTTDGTHHNYVFVWSYDWNNGVPSNWHHSYTWSRNDKRPWPAEFHQLRVADVDGNGIDEMLQGGYSVNPVQGMVASAGIGHGDRYDVSDINPDRPGMEVYAIQQSSTMGQLIYDAATGEHLKEWYMGAVSDVGRGRCIDVDANYKGYEVFSTMANLYDCKGNVITEGETSYPFEASWWDGDLQREMISSPGGDGYGSNAMITKYNGTRLIQFSKESNWAVHSGWANRPLYMGDMTGDWREEVILMKQNEDTSSGIVGYSTNIASNYSMYTLQEDPAYRLNCTTRGYYQAPCTSFYLGGEMPYPPLPPTMVADLRWANGATWMAEGNGFTSFDQMSSLTYVDGKRVIFDISGENAQVIDIPDTVKPLSVYLMTPKNHDYTFAGTGSLAGEMTLYKSMLGTATFHTNLNHEGGTVISEGTLCVNGTIAGPLDLRAKGTLAGNAVVNGDVTFEGALNYEGCRLSPGNASSPYGKISFAKDLTLSGTVYLQMDLRTEGTVQMDTIAVNGNLTAKGTNTINIISDDTTLQPGEYPLVQWTGELTGGVSNFNVMGVVGLSYDLQVKDKQLMLVINGQRQATTGVVWTGAESSIWDFKAGNFALAGEQTSFVQGDEIVFNDEAAIKDVRLDAMMSTKGITFLNESTNYTISGNGGISGEGALVKQGAGQLTLSAKASDYTGATQINAGTLVVTDLADAGSPSPIGAATANCDNFVLSNATLTIDNSSVSSNRGLTVKGNVTIKPLRGTSTLKGVIAGDGQLIKEGDGQLNLAYEGANTYTGGTVVKKGTLAMGAWNTTFGKLGSSILMEGGALQIFSNNSTSTVPVFDYALSIPASSNISVYAGKRCKIGGTLTGSGTLNLNLPYVRADLIGNWSNFSGQLNVTGNQFRLCNNNGLQNADIYLKEEVYMGHYAQGSNNALSGGSSKIGSLSGDVGVHLVNGSYQVGYNNNDATYNGILESGVTISKYGSGKWTLTNANLCSSAFTIYAGSVVLQNSEGSATGSGAVTVKSGATLCGTGSCSGTLSVESGATLSGEITVGGNATIAGMISVGTSPSILLKTMTFQKQLSLRETGSIEMRIYGYAKNDIIKVGGTFSPNGTLIITQIGTAAIADGTVYSLFQAESIAATTFDSISLPELPENMYWDVNELYLNGSITARVRDGLNSDTSEPIFDVYPTRTSESITVQTGSFQGKAQMKICSLHGKAFIRQNLSANESKNISLDKLSSGIYIVIFQKEDTQVIKRIVKE